MKIFTIGFTKTSAKSFFDRLRFASVKTLIDVRLNNVSQLAGFAKRDDLKYFLREICDIGYQHEPSLAPTQEMLDTYRKSGADWATYETRYLALIAQRGVEASLNRELFEDCCLLCSEDRAEKCHRRLAAEYLGKHWPGLEIRHL